MHLVCIGFCSSYLDRGESRVDRGYVNAALSEKAGEGARPTSDIQHGVSAQLFGERYVCVEIPSILMQLIVKSYKSRLLK